MSFEHIGFVKEALSSVDANQLLQQGWILLAAVPNTTAQAKSTVVYVLGKPKAGAAGLWGGEKKP